MEPTGGPFSSAGEKRLWPVPLGVGGGRIRLFIDGPENSRSTVEFELLGASTRPALPGHGSHGGRSLMFLLALKDRFANLLDRDAQSGPPRAEHHPKRSMPLSQALRRVFEALPAQGGATSVILRQAETVRRTVEALATRPRSAIERTRRSVPVGWIQEWDAACFERYARLPGRTAAEKSAGRDGVLALKREERLDTTENRVLRSYLEHAASAAASYTSRVPEAQDTATGLLVARFGRSCRRFARELAEKGVGKPIRAPDALEALGWDDAYRSIWEADQELIRLKDEEDALWAWQLRAWQEFVHLAIHAAIRERPGATVVAETPVKVRSAANRGRRLDLTPHSSVLRASSAGREFAVTVIDPQEERAAAFGPPHLWPLLWSIGTDSVLHAQDLESGDEDWILVWSLHPLTEDPVDLENEARSAESARMRVAEQVHGFGSGGQRLRGLVLVSSLGGETAPKSSRSGDTLCCLCPTDPRCASITIGQLSNLLMQSLGSGR